MGGCPERATLSGPQQAEDRPDTASDLAGTGVHVALLQALQEGCAAIRIQQVTAGSWQVRALICATRITPLSAKHAEHGRGAACRLPCTQCVADAEVCVFSYVPIDHWKANGKLSPLAALKGSG